jgi:hypothetical protein
MAEHGAEADHWIEFHQTGVTAKTSGFMDRLVREAMKIMLHPDKTNTEEWFRLRRAWYPSGGLLRHIAKIPRRHREQHAEGNKRK